ncbi:MAG: hypothetical protein BGN97_01625 [Microbacterium sp. 69-10]|nr:MAG: hypothetical protein BGN97_01625 [Microbacterium sp. 69-10]
MAVERDSHPMSENNENTSVPGEAADGGAPDTTPTAEAASAPTPDAAPAAPAAAEAPPAPPAQGAPVASGASTTPILPTTPVDQAAPYAAPAQPGAPAGAAPAKPFWSRTGTRIGAGVVGGVVILMLGFGGGWVAHSVVRPFGMHEQAWGGPGGDRGMPHDGFGGQRAPRGGQGFGDGQRPGGPNGSDDGSTGGSDSDDTPTPESTPGS